MMNTEAFKAEHFRVVQELAALRKELQASPPGHLYICRQGNHTKWLYHESGKPSKYLAKKEKQLASSLFRKKYAEAKIAELTCQLKLMEQYLKCFPTVSPAEQLLQDPSCADLLPELYRPARKELNDWEKADYPRSEDHPEHLTLKGLGGRLFRSKSEMLIDTLLAQNEIPRRYECELNLDGIRYYPDFTIRHPKSGAFYYWEHFGLMDDRNYLTAFTRKITYYTNHGLLLGLNLICTSETADTPLSADAIQKTIDLYFS